MKQLFICTFLLLGFIFSQSTYACSCICMDDQYVSEYASEYEVFWGLPIESKFDRENQNQRNVVTTIEVLEDYNLNLSNTVDVASASDSGMCGVQLNLGRPELITAYKSADGERVISSCRCEPPLDALFNYLENGSDALIPHSLDCFNPTSDSAKESCKVWENEKNGHKKYNAYVSKHLDELRNDQNSR